MSVRLFPDIIVASEIKESLDQIYLICKNNNNINLFKEVSKIYISTERCVQRQHSYAKRGLGNVFLGFEGKDWTINDFIYYFKSNPQIFKHDIQNRYYVKINKKLPDKINNFNDIKLFINNYCLSLLLQETYNPRILAKFGLIIKHKEL